MSNSDKKWVKPPLGCKPRWLCDEGRLADLRQTLHRYFLADAALPVNVVMEYNSLVVSTRARKESSNGGSRNS